MDQAETRYKQIAQAEELLGGSNLERAGFAIRPIFRPVLNERLLPYPDLSHDDDVHDKVDELRTFCREQIDPVKIDREAMIPDSVVAGLGRLGVLGALFAKSCGGLEWSQTQYCKLLEYSADIAPAPRCLLTHITRSAHARSCCLARERSRSLAAETRQR